MLCRKSSLLEKLSGNCFKHKIRGNVYGGQKEQK